jgi:hypothetical protein
MTTLCFLLLTCLYVSSSCGQSLAEVAQKERQRREALNEGRVYRENDLEAAGDGISIVGVESSKEDRDSRQEERTERERATDEEWNRIFSGYRTRFESVRAARDRYSDQYVNGIPAGAEGKRIPCRRILSRWHLPGWVEHAIACENLETTIQEQEALLREIQRECLNEARKMGVPPGRARLN